MIFNTHSLTHKDALFVAEHMRSEDLRELTATRGSFLLPERVAFDCFNILGNGGIGYVGYAGKKPVAALGAVEMHQGVWTVYMFATDALPEIGLGLTRWARRVLHPEIIAAGAHRIECHSIEGHSEAHAWMESFGAKNEGIVPRFGIEQETFYRFAWTGD